MSAPEPTTRSPRRVLGVGSWAETLRVGEILRRETTGGVLLLVAALIALIWANSPAAGSYFGLRDFVVGPEALHLDLSLGAWAADGLLAIFFFLVGLELKHEFVAGDLRDPQRAMVPVAAAAGGVIVPALVFVALNLASPETLRGWAIPTATDIAFAVAVLAIIGSHLPAALRIFLLTLAVVDDLIAILIIALVYTEELHVPELLATLIPVALYAYLVQRHTTFFATRTWAPWLILLPLGAIAWALLHASGIHATIAGVVLGFTIPVKAKNGLPGEGLARRFEHAYRPLSTGFAVPVFAFFSAGVAVGGWEGFTNALTSPVALGIILGLVVGKPVGILLTTWGLIRFTRAELDGSLRWGDIFGVGLLAGIGFTVSLLVAELSFGLGSDANDQAKVGILVASFLAALLAAALLIPRNRRYRAIEAAQSVDADADGIPDVYEDAEESGEVPPQPSVKGSGSAT